MELPDASAVELTRDLASGALTSTALTKRVLARIDAREADINALTLVRRDEVLTEAAIADQKRGAGGTLGKLHGLPITIKDTFRVGGVRSTFGALPQYRFHTPRTDCTLVTRLRNAGALILGRSNTPLLALDWQSGNPFFGQTRNPFDLTRTPGGSSGGASAALAAGFTTLELGSDLGGSIRYPAHCCGVYGLRPSEGALPLDDTGPEGLPLTFPQIFAAGPMARTLPDLRLMWDVLRDSETRTKRVDGSLRIAVTRRMAGVDVDRETAHALDRYLNTLRRAGHRVDEAREPSIDFEEAYRLTVFISGYNLRQALPDVLARPPMRTLFELYMFRFKLGDGLFGRGMSEGMAASRAQFEEALVRREVLRASIDRFFDATDLWVLPVAATPAIKRQAYGHSISIDDRRTPYALALGAFTVPTACLGTPALCVPIGRGETTSLPIGVQIHARHGNDDVLLAMADNVSHEPHAADERSASAGKNRMKR